MLPMAYAVRQNALVPFALSPRVPAPSDAEVARSAWETAVAFWRTVAAQEEVSEGFRRIALENAQKVAALDAALARLPA